MRKIRNCKGITLVALVITIIILIILAGVSINIVFDEDGIIQKAKRAAQNTNKAQIEEQIELYKTEAYLNNEELKDVLIKYGMVDQEELKTNGISKINGDEKYLAISSSNGLKILSNSVKNGNDYLGVVVYLLNDIDFNTTFNSETGELLTGESFEPIGDTNSTIEDEQLEGSIKKEFNGIFNGLNYIIENLYINENEEGKYCTGLFGYVGENGVVENVIVKESYISGNYETGSIVGRNKGTIKNCINYSSISANKLTGGIAGRNCGTIENCTNYGNIYTTNIQTGGIVANCDFGKNVIVNKCKNYGNISSLSNVIGGIVGGSYKGKENINNVNVIISNCENYGEIGGTTDNYNYVGGIVGHLRNVVKNCTNNGVVKGWSNVGGVAGVTIYYDSSTLIENSINIGKIEGYYTKIGGICGNNSGGTISKCSNNGEISLIGENAYFGVGGIAGASGADKNDTRIENCYNEGKIILELSNSETCQIAGIVGNLGMDKNGTYTGYILNCYNKGEIVCTNSVGNKNSSGIGSFGRHIVVKNCYNIGTLISPTGISKGIWASYDKSLDSTFENNYWLDSCGADYGLGVGNSNVDAKVVDSEELKKLAETLGDAYIADTTNINNGYPILKWQVK